MSDDLLATVTFKNKRLRDAMAGRTGREIALVAGCRPDHIYGYGSLRDSPYRKLGELKASAKALCDYFELSAEELFPPSLYSGGIPSKIERTYDSVEVLPLLAARGHSYVLDEAEVDRHRLAEVMEDKLNTLTYYQRRVLELRYGLGGEKEHGIREIGRRLDYSAERIRQIEAKAIRRMRHGSRAKALKPFIECDVEVSSTS